MKRNEVKVIGKNTFKWDICSCGCKKYYWHWLNPDNPLTFKIVGYGNQWHTNSVFGTSSKIVDAIEREDGQQFKEGDLVQRITPMGKKFGKGIIRWIQIEKNGFLQIHCNVIGKRGSFSIRNEKSFMSGSNPDIFNFLQNITKI